MSFVKRMRKKWGVGLWGFTAIMAVFALAGSSVVRLKNPILNFVLPEHVPAWIRAFTYILLIMPLYQMCLLFWGTLLGQFRFFWEKEKKLVLWIWRKCSFTTKSVPIP